MNLIVGLKVILVNLHHKGLAVCVLNGSLYKATQYSMFIDLVLHFKPLQGFTCEVFFTGKNMFSLLIVFPCKENFVRKTLFSLLIVFPCKENFVRKTLFSLQVFPCKGLQCSTRSMNNE